MAAKKKASKVSKKKAVKPKEEKEEEEVVAEEEETEEGEEEGQEEEEETTEDDTPQYAGSSQPTWVTDPPDVTLESERGYRIHVWPDFGKHGRVMVTKPDWEDGEGLHPGKVVKMNMDDLAQLLTGVLKEVYQHNIELS